MRRRTKAFTLIELLVVIAIIALLVSILMPSLTKARELAKRASCKMNLSAVAKGMSMYQSNNNDCYPLMPGKNWDITETGNIGGMAGVYKKEYDPVTEVGEASVTALMFMLVKDGQGVKLFKCPSDDGAVADPSPTYADDKGSTYYHWDFGQVNPDQTAYTGTTRYCSYSYQVPMSNDTNGVTSASEGGLVIMGDRVPCGTDSAAYGPENTWASGLDKAMLTQPDELKRYNSQNHTGGEVVNVLRADSSVSESKTPLCGLSVGGITNLDNIFTNRNNSGGASTTVDGIDVGGSQAYSGHTGIRDAYLGGCKDKSATK